MILARFGVAALSAVLVASAAAQSFTGGKWIDLTHPFDSDTIHWPTAKTCEKQTVFEVRTPGGYFYSACNFCSAEHGGTHVDAPVHFAEDALPTDRVPVS